MPRKRPARGKKRKRTAPGVDPVENEQGALDVLFSISQAAYVLGRDRATIAKRIASFGILPKGKRRKNPVYSARELREKLDQYEDDGSRNPDKMNPGERLMHYKAETEKLRVNVERGLHCVREDVEREWARVLKLIALELDTIVDHVERDIGAAPLILTRIEQQIDKIRERMFAGVIAAEEEPEVDAAAAQPA